MAADPKEDPAGSSAEPGKQADVAIDISETSRGAQKVELDLDDAPFLEEEEEVQPEPVKPSAPLDVEAAPKEKQPLGKKKLLIIGGAALILLLVLGLAVKLLFFKGKTAPVQHAEPAANATTEHDNATAPEPEKPEVLVRLDPFWVEQKAGPEEVRFLIVRILLGTKDPAIAKEFEMKIMPARNAVFYYLKNKDVHFLSDEENTEKLKAELLMVINQYVTDGKFETLMFEEYVVK